MALEAGMGLARMRFVLRRAAFLFLLVTPACSAGDSLELGQKRELVVAPETRLDRVTAIRDVSAGLGLYNGVLLAGIAQSETMLAHCWSEATWACQGPDSPSCDDGPVIAGSADGPCSDRQGGLGMFQFDAGTYEDTLARDGEDILLLEGNIARAVEFVVARTIEAIPEASDHASALAWLNSIPIEAGAPLMDEWASMIVCQYNGCCNDSATCTTRRAGYRDNAIELYEEFGAGFWSESSDSSNGCQAIPTKGRIIDETDACYVRGGDARYWRRVESGYDGGQDWTMATASDNAANYGIWRLDFETAGSYLVEVHLDGVGQSQQAAYKIRHAGVTDTVIIDQSAGDGWVALGRFDFTAGPGQEVELGDNTGEPGGEMKELSFDAIRVRHGGDGGCSTGGQAPWTTGLALLGLVVATRRRRRAHC